MTVIAYRDGVMAADRQAFAGSTRANEATKIARRESDGALVGADGCASLASAFMRWFIAGEIGDRPPMGTDSDNRSEALVIRSDGRVEEHDRFGWHACEGEFFAIGRGTDFALTAMVMGADAVRAIEVAMKLEAYTGGGVDVVRLVRATCLKEEERNGKGEKERQRARPGTRGD